MNYLLKRMLKFAATKIDNAQVQLGCAGLFGMIELLGTIKTIKLLNSVYQEHKRNARS